jgi:hypothetical protein
LRRRSPKVKSKKSIRKIIKVHFQTHQLKQNHLGNRTAHEKVGNFILFTEIKSIYIIVFENDTKNDLRKFLTSSYLATPILLLISKPSKDLAT